jgi:hypothetical protein
MLSQTRGLESGVTLEDYLNTLRREFRASLVTSLKRRQEDEHAPRLDADARAVARTYRLDGSSND